MALEEFRASLVEPYWISVEVRDSLEDIHRDPPLCRDCMVVATDQAGMILAFDLEARGFVLITRSSSGGYETFGVRGDAVGCFLSR